jgi:hypothetical protein
MLKGVPYMKQIKAYIIIPVKKIIQQHGVAVGQGVTVAFKNSRMDLHETPLILSFCQADSASYNFQNPGESAREKDLLFVKTSL